MTSLKWIQVRTRWHAVLDSTERTLCGQNVGDLPYRDLREKPRGTVCINCWRQKPKQGIPELPCQN